MICKPGAHYGILVCIHQVGYMLAFFKATTDSEGGAVPYMSAFIAYAVRLAPILAIHVFLLLIGTITIIFRWYIQLLPHLQYNLLLQVSAALVLLQVLGEHYGHILVLFFTIFCSMVLILIGPLVIYANHLFVVTWKKFSRLDSFVVLVATFHHLSSKGQYMEVLFIGHPINFFESYTFAARLDQKEIILLFVLDATNGPTVVYNCVIVKEKTGGWEKCSVVYEFLAIVLIAIFFTAGMNVHHLMSDNCHALLKQVLASPKISFSSPQRNYLSAFLLLVQATCRIILAHCCITIWNCPGCSQLQLLFVLKNLVLVVRVLIMAVVAYRRRQCDNKLIHVTNKNSLFKLQARYVVARLDADQ